VTPLKIALLAVIAGLVAAGYLWKSPVPMLALALLIAAVLIKRQGAG